MKQHVYLLAIATLFITGCNTLQPVKLQIHEQVAKVLPASHVREVELPLLDLKIAIDPFPSLTDYHVRSAELYPTDSGMGILLKFDQHGMNLLNQVTTASRGKYLVFFLDNQPVSAWLVDHPITNGELLLRGPLDPAVAKQAVESLNREGARRDRLLW